MKLFRYGEEKHMISFLEKGELFLSSASSYKERTLSRGVSDPEEREIYQQLNPQQHNVKISVYDGKTKKFKGNLSPIGNITKGWKLSTDYYLFSLSLKYDMFLYDEFNSDTCICINKPEIFIEKMYDSLDHVFPNWAVLAKPVSYISKFHYLTENIDICFCKEDCFSYQNEFRFICLPDEKKKKLSRIKIEIGSLRNIGVLLKKVNN